MTINFAHRGYRARYPENTLLAFRKAIEVGCSGIELDVQLTKDNEIVIIHDEDVKRTTNGNGAVCGMMLEQIRALDAGNSEKIPLLSEYFDIIENLPIITNIELKNSVVPYDGMEERVLEMVRSRGLSNRIIFSSFNHYSVRKMKKLAPDILCGFIFSGKHDVEALIKSQQETGVEFLHPGINNIDDKFMACVKKYDIRYSVWTVNDAPVMRKLIEHDAYGIFTDNPELLAGVLNDYTKYYCFIYYAESIYAFTHSLPVNSTPLTPTA